MGSDDRAARRAKMAAGIVDAPVEDLHLALADLNRRKHSFFTLISDGKAEEVEDAIAAIRSVLAKRDGADSGDADS